MKKKLITIILVTAMAASLIACGNKEPQSAIEYGEIEDKSESSENKEEIVSEAGLPTYDPLSATKAMEYGNDWKLEEKTSYYKDQLGSRPKRAFDSIYYAAENMLGSVELTDGSQLITPAELENIMHIIFLDCPELFWLDAAFSYSANSDGYVTNVNLYYVMEENSVENIKEKNAKIKPQYIELMKKNDYDSIKSLLREIAQSIGDWETVGINTDGNYDFSSSNPFVGSKKNSIGISKMITYWLRQCGLDCTVAIGEPVSSTLEDNYELVADFMNFKEVQNSDGFYTVRFNYPYYWMWNIVKIDDQWYNLDFAYSNLLKEFDKVPYDKDTMWFATDLMMSQTRLSYMNEEILGIMPSCTDVNFQSSYRDGSFILSLTETQSLRKLQEIILTCDSENKKEVVYQCQDEQTFNYLIANLDEQIDNYNNTYNNPIGSYKTLFIRDNLTISIYDIIYNF